MITGDLATRLDTDRRRRTDQARAAEAGGAATVLLPFALALARLAARLDVAEARR